MTVRLLSHVGICVDDLDLALRFYTGALGFVETVKATVGDEFAPVLGLASADVEVRLIALGDRPAGRIELIHYRKPTAQARPDLPPNNIGFTHLAMYVDDIDTVCRRVREQGGVVLEGRKAVLHINGEQRVYQMCVDPFGTRIELIQATVRG